MNTRKLLTLIAPKDLGRAEAFATEIPPHPDELRKTNETLTVGTTKNCPYDQITLARSRMVEGNHVHQFIGAVGQNLEGPETIKTTLLGYWAREEFPRPEKTKPMDMDTP
jgi:hypothetical protein